MKFHVHLRAQAEGVEVAGWYDEQAPGQGSRFSESLRNAIDRIKSSPETLPRLETYVGEKDVRRYLLDGFPYLVIFTIQPQDVLVVAVMHAKRDPLYWVDRL